MLVYEGGGRDYMVEASELSRELCRVEEDRQSSMRSLLKDLNFEWRDVCAIVSCEDMRGREEEMYRGMEDCWWFSRASYSPRVQP